MKLRAGKILGRNPHARTMRPAGFPDGRPGRTIRSWEKQGSTLIIVLWIAFGLVSIALYFAHSMSFELRASDNRVAGLVADQAIEGAARYVNYLLANQAANSSNGIALDPATYACRAVPVGDAHFWLIGRATNSTIGPGQFSFGLVEEASKLNLNTASSNMLVWLPRMTLGLTTAILDWRDTNGAGASQMYYSMLNPPYQCKNAPFETVDEVRLLFGADMDTLIGEDANRNGVLDPNENDVNHNGMLEPGVLEYLTVYSREPNTNSDGTASINIKSLSSNSTGPLLSLLQTNFGAERANAILQRLGLVVAGGNNRGGRGTPGGTSPGRNPTTVTVTFNSPLQFFVRSGMTSDEFAQLANQLTVASGAYIQGRINVNTASAAVLACLLDGDTDTAQQLVNYRQMNPNRLTSIAWVIDAIGQNNPTAVQTLAAGDYLTTHSYQFTADVAALGPYGRGYRRTRFVFDTCDGTPKILYRQDLSHIGWALGEEIRQAWLLAKSTR